MSLPLGPLGALSLPSTIALALAAYLPLQRYLRGYRERSAQRRYKITSRDDLGQLSMDQSAEILRELAELEMTDAFTISLGYGFLQTLAFPDSSALLAHTKQISNPDQSAKRLFDTSTLMVQLFSFPPSSDRFRLALSRINYLHSRYGARITNEQLVYVLAVFAVNPWIWAEQWEWREMNELEIAALGTFWMGVGRMMGIDMAEIAGAGRGDPRYVGAPGKNIDGGPWSDGLDWMLDMRAYMQVQEQRSLGNSPDVEALVGETFRMILAPWPRWMQGWMKRLPSVDFEPRFREPSNMPAPPAYMVRLITWPRIATKYFRRYLGLPRPHLLTNRHAEDKPDPATGRYGANLYGAYPYYVKPTLWRRWKPFALVQWTLGVDRPGDRPNKYHPDGYKIEELGPPRWQGKGDEWMQEDIRRGQQAVPSGATCPFGFGVAKEVSE